MKHPLLLTCVFTLGINGYAQAASFEEKRDMLLERLNAITDVEQEQDEQSSSQDDLRCPCSRPRPHRTAETTSVDTEDADVRDDVLDIEDAITTEQVRNELEASTEDLQDIEADETGYSINEAGERCPCSRPRPRPRAQ